MTVIIIMNFSRGLIAPRVVDRNQSESPCDYHLMDSKIENQQRNSLQSLDFFASSVLSTGQSIALTGKFVCITKQTYLHCQNDLAGISFKSVNLFSLMQSVVLSEMLSGPNLSCNHFMNEVIFSWLEFMIKHNV